MDSLPAQVDVPGVPGVPAGVLTAIRAATHRGFDRVVLQFSSPFTGYSVQYVKQLLADPSGEVVKVRGTATLQVTIQGATLDNAYQAGGSIAARRYSGRLPLDPGLPEVREVVSAGDFESVLTFGIGVSRQAGFRVLRLSGPDRLVIDVA